MKTFISLLTLLVAMAAGTAYAAQTYGGTGAGRGGFVGSTGFVKERGNAPQDKMGKDQPDADDKDADDKSDADDAKDDDTKSGGN